MRLRLAPWRSIVYLTAVLVAAVGVFARTPYTILAPGRALDLRDVVKVQGYAPPSTHYYMTDVSVIEHASPFGLLVALEPGWDIVRTDTLVPVSIDDAAYEKIMVEQMNQSQGVAAYVAERAAGLHQQFATTRVVIYEVLPSSHARGVLRPGDIVVSVDGHVARGRAGLESVLSRVPPGTTVKVVTVRAGQHVASNVRTIPINGTAHLGVGLSEIATLPSPAVPVRYGVRNISGSSGGVMFALEIYRSFHPARHSPAQRIAGTGTLDSDGTVGQIAGTMQKVIAARRAGATLFLVPADNYADVRLVTGIRIVSIRTFADAIEATDGV